MANPWYRRYSVETDLINEEFNRDVERMTAEYMSDLQNIRNGNMYTMERIIRENTVDNPRQLWNSSVGQTGNNPQHSITDAELERQMNEFFRDLDNEPNRNIVSYTRVEGNRVFQEMLAEEARLMFGQTLTEDSRELIPTEAPEPIELNLDFMQVQSIFKPTINFTSKITLPASAIEFADIKTTSTTSTMFTWSSSSILPF